MLLARQLSPFVFLALLVATLVYVLWRGRAAERACVAVIAIGSVISAVAANERVFESTETGIFVVDVLVLAGFIAITGASRRFWPIWITAFQIVAVMTHLARLLQPGTVPLAYAIAEQLWVLPMQGILVAVVWRYHWQRRLAGVSCY